MRKEYSPMKQSAKACAYIVIAAGGIILATTLSQWSSSRFAVCLVFLAVTALTSLVKLRLPHINGTYSLNFLVLLYGLARFSLAALAVWPRPCNPYAKLKSGRPVQVFFNMANISLSLAFCFLLRRALLDTGMGSNPAALMRA